MGRIIAELRRFGAGLLLWPADLVVCLAAGVLSVPPRNARLARPALRALAAETDRHRRWRWARVGPTPHGPRATRYLLGRVVFGGVQLLMAVLIGYGIHATVDVLRAAITGGFSTVGQGPIRWATVAALIPLGALFLFMGVATLVVCHLLDRWWWLECGSDPDAVVAHLRRTRADVLAAVDAERRRIERDLHDGAQADLVALGLLLGRAQRADDPDRAELLDRAHRSTLKVLTDLRAVSWRIYPVHLDSEGLHGALLSLAERSPVSVQVRQTCDDDELPLPVKLAVWFTAAEAVGNALKHTDTEHITIDLGVADNRAQLLVTDHGAGGADPRGTGLSGLAQRAAALDGSLAIHSPVGGPTTLTLEIPCG